MSAKLTSLVALVAALYAAGCGPTSPTGVGGSSGAGGTGGGSGGTAGSGPLPGDIDVSIPGRFRTQAYSNGWADSPAYAGATIYYAPEAPTPWAGVAVVPGFTETQLAGWGQVLAAHGFVTITVDTNTGGDFPDVRANALDAAIATLKAEGARAGSPLQGKMSTSYGIMGHSMGGGGKLIASTRTVYGAAVALMAWPAGSTHPTSRTPTLAITAENDILVDQAGSEASYRSIGAPYKAWTEYRGETHSFANYPLYSGHPALAGTYALAWFEIFLHNDPRYKPVIANNSAFSGFDVHL